MIRLMAKTTTDRRRIWRGDRNDTPIMMAVAGNRYRMWRLTKKNGSRPRRPATGGLAASDSTTPINISAPMAPMVSRSTVHHHSPNGVRCARETMSQSRLRPKLTRHGLRSINGEGFGGEKAVTAERRH